MKNIFLLGITVIFLFSFSGCSARNDGGKGKVSFENIEDIEKYRNGALLEARSNLNPYQMKIKPIVGSRQDDTKIVVDMGKVIKIWVSPYKSGSTMVASHDIYTWVQKPRFIPGESVPTPRNASGVTNLSNKLPFVFNENELLKEGDFNSQDVKEYVNTVYKVQKNDKLIQEFNDKASLKFDSSIEEYLKEKKD